MIIRVPVPKTNIVYRIDLDNRTHNRVKVRL